MGNRYNICCLDCDQHFYLGGENTWWQDEELMYCLKDFLLSHCDHNLKIGGDEWNRAFVPNDLDFQLPLKDSKQFDKKYSIVDFKDYQKADSYKFNDDETRRLTKVWKEDEWLSFELVEEKPKTKVFAVISKCSDCDLGIVKWHPKWRHYCFFPTIEEEMVYSDSCLKSISEFISELNKQHKEERASSHT